ncbi:MAG TPA: hypothetical protein VFA29_13885 [Candidatus Baltobacteraceae bacterium]|nr:hypothetical protein [Candidatus Baltobacteraceae bacterium]
MKHYGNDDDLERALFALDLEEPPADLRRDILAATIYRPQVAVPAWELWLMGAVCALLTWVAVLAGHNADSQTISILTHRAADGLAALAKPQTLLWAAAGGGLVLWISQLNLTPVAGALRATRR